MNTNTMAAKERKAFGRKKAQKVLRQKHFAFFGRFMRSFAADALSTI